MNKLTPRHILALLSLLPLGAGPLMAQSAPSGTTAPNANSARTSSIPDEEVITLDPFTVSTEHEGYKSDDTLAGGRVRTLLKDTPSSLSVVTSKFLQDLGITKIEDLLI